MILNAFQKMMPTDKELELRFLRHLAYRASYEGGKYLSERDKLALARLTEAHPQDTSSTSVSDLAVEEYLELNPHHIGRYQ
jgi:hypothetical protein